MRTAHQQHSQSQSSNYAVLSAKRSSAVGRPVEHVVGETLMESEVAGNVVEGPRPAYL